MRKVEEKNGTVFMTFCKQKKFFISKKKSPYYLIKNKVRLINAEKIIKTKKGSIYLSRSVRITTLTRNPGAE